MKSNFSFEILGLDIFPANNTFLLFLDLDDQLRNMILILNLILITEPFSIFYSEIFIRGQFARIFKIKFFQTLIFFTLKIFLVFNNFDIILIVGAYVLENLFFSIIVIYYFKKNGNNFSNLIFEKKHFDGPFKEGKKLNEIKILLKKKNYELIDLDEENIQASKK